MNIRSILLTLLAINSLASAALFAIRGDVFATIVFLVSIPLFLHLENSNEAV